MQKILTAQEMREVDRLTTEKYGIPSIILMENAAHAAADAIKEKLGGSVAGKSFLILCGKGNNGGDGAALARILVIKGAKIDLVLFGKIEETTGDARVNFEICQKLANFDSQVVDTNHPDIYRDSGLYESDGTIGFSEVNSREEFDKLLYGEFYQDWNCIIDAVFGTGLSRTVEGWLANVIHHLNILNDTQINYFKKSRLLVSIDIPSGLNADSANQVGENFQADSTITFTAPKLANVLPPASNFNGELIVANIGSPQELIDNSPSQTFLAEKEDAQIWLEKTKYAENSYKNKRGHALLVVGSREYTGAGVLAGNAAMLSGVGLVTIATSESAQTAISSKVLEEIIVRGLPETKDGTVSDDAFDEIEKLSEKVDVIGIGCGLGITGRSPRVSKGGKDLSQENPPLLTRGLLPRIVEKRRTPIVIDADGLNALAPFALKGSDEFPLVLTPHEGEFLRLLGTTEREVLKDRVAVVREFAQKHHVILVLKGERTLIAAPDGRVVINPTGNSGLGKAGNGDTLAGIITGFAAQAAQMQIDMFETIVAAVYIAGTAGDIAAEKYGKRSMLASDVRTCLTEAFEAIKN